LAELIDVGRSQRLHDQSALVLIDFDVVAGDAFDTEAKEFVCLVQMFGTLFSSTCGDISGVASNPKMD
jgi:hypothetical protein